MSKSQASELMTLIGAAFRLKISPQWLREEAQAGRIPALDCGGAMLVNINAVETALARRAAGAGPAPQRLTLLDTRWPGA